MYTCGPLSFYCSVCVRLPFREPTNHVSSQESPPTFYDSRRFAVVLTRSGRKALPDPDLPFKYEAQTALFKEPVRTAQ